MNKKIYQQPHIKASLLGECFTIANSYPSTNVDPDDPGTTPDQFQAKGVGSYNVWDEDWSK